MSLYYISTVRFTIAFTTNSLQIDMSIYVSAIKQLNLSINITYLTLIQQVMNCVFQLRMVNGEAFISNILKRNFQQ
jgi:hypothetical protein